MARRLDARAPDFAAQFSALISRETEEDVAASVRSIIADVRKRGDAALFELTSRFDKVALTAQMLRLGQAEIDAAESQCSKDALAALDVAAKRIETYHRRQLPKDDSFTDDIGATLGWRAFTLTAQHAKSPSSCSTRWARPPSTKVCPSARCCAMPS